MLFHGQGRLSAEAPAKINLFLRVTGRREDGYHFLSTWMQKVGLYDSLELTLCAEGIRLDCTGNAVNGVPVNRDNIVCRAAELFLQATRDRRKGSLAGVTIRLIKRIPVAAGLGGGSSDAAVTLRGLNALHGDICSAEELAGLGLRLGADVPFFLADAPSAVATGIGEVLQPVVSLRDCVVVLVNPGFSVSTRWVYQTFALTNKDLASNLGNSQEAVGGGVGPSWPLPALSAEALLVNDLETVTIPHYPELTRIKEKLLRCGAVNALMSGSGPTVFGLFATQREAEGCADLCRRRYPHTFLVAPLEENKF